MSNNVGGTPHKQTMITNFFKKSSENDVKKSRKRPRVEIKMDKHDCRSICVSGINIEFPGMYDPYPSQSLIMEANISSFNKSNHVLIESPTGSGKTMALLSSSIGWLRHYKDNKNMSFKSCPMHGNNYQSKENASEVLKKKVKVEEEKCNVSENIANNDNIKVESKEKEYSVKCTCMEEIKIYYATRTHKQIAQVIKELKRLPYCYKNSNDKTVINHTILSAREHTCIHPDVKDLPNVSEKCKEIDLDDNTKCRFKMKLIQKFDESKKELICKEIPPVWDIEELVEFGDKKRLCPHFAASTFLRKDADIIFCPFNYIIDPIIRDTANIDLKNSIVILDEAHNIESFCRSSSSFNFTEKEIIHSLNNVYLRRNLLKKHIEKDPSKLWENEAYGEEEMSIPIGKKIYLNECLQNLEYLLKFMQTFLNWFRSFSLQTLNVSSKEGTQAKVLRTSEIMRSLADSKLIIYKNNAIEFKKLKDAWISASSIGDGDENDISNVRTENEKKLRKYKINSLCIVCIEKFIYFIRFLMKSPNAYRLNYSIEESNTEFDIFNCKNKEISKFSDSSILYTDTHEVVGDTEKKKFDNLIGGEKYEQIKKNCIVKMDLWCLDPSLCFVDAFHNVHSIVLASGTLSPIDTFVSELGMKFETIVQGNQVVPKEQFFPSVIGVGPNNRDIICTRNELISAEKQIGRSMFLEIGSLIVDVCENVGKGVLVFFPSYYLLEEVWTKLFNSKLMLQLKNVKCVLKEPRKSGELENIMMKYERAIKTPEDISKSCTGAVLFAVFRGKFSEGIDFADDLARCVISIGIPFPNSLDEQVKEKKDFNNKFRVQKNLLSGEEWYKIEAYRALNQALGRCLRHRNDWGLIIMVDKRLFENVKKNNPDKNKISKWVVDDIKSYNNYKNFKNEMKKFVGEREKLSSPVKKESI